jgi:hypothetical protein
VQAGCVCVVTKECNRLQCSSDDCRRLQTRSFVEDLPVNIVDVRRAAVAAVQTHHNLLFLSCRHRHGKEAAAAALRYVSCCAGFDHCTVIKMCAAATAVLLLALA